MPDPANNRFSTVRLICWTFVIALLAWMLLYASMSNNTDNHFARVVFALSYLALWPLAVIAPFRPESKFTLRGEHEARLRNLVFAIGAIATLMVLSYVALLAT